MYIILCESLAVEHLTRTMYYVHIICMYVCDVKKGTIRCGCMKTSSQMMYMYIHTCTLAIATKNYILAYN